MVRIVMLQCCVALFTAIVFGLLKGQTGAVSALLGGLCCIVPNALFALSLYVGTKNPHGANPTTFFVGEFIKIVTTTALVFAVVMLYHGVSWLAFLVSFILVLKSYFILLLRN